MKLRECTAKEVLVQTRSEPDPLVSYASRGASERFFDDEIALREQLKYPPFARFILLTWSGTQAIVAEAEKVVRMIMDTTHTQYYSNPHSTPTETQRHGFIRVDATDTALYEELIDKARRLPPYIKIEINPERIV